MASAAWDLLDRRILAALRFIDALGRAVTCPLALSAPAGVRWYVKRPGMLIVTDAPGLAAYAAAFDAPTGAPAADFQIDVRPADPAYGPRRIALRLPRNPAPADPGSIFLPVEIVLPPGITARPSGLAAGLRVVVTRGDDGRAIEGALVRLRPAGGRPQTIAVTNAAGEALLLADAIPLASPGAGAVMLGDFAADLDAVIDPAQARFHAAADIFAARRAAEARTSGFVDPDALAPPATPAVTVRIAAGRVGDAAIQWNPP